MMMDNQQPILEVCTGSLASVAAAVEGGAKRIELCQALSLDGLTPSTGLVKTVRSLYPELRIHVLVRSMEGGFVYDDREIQLMTADIHEVIEAGADAVVVGALTPDADIDLHALRLWMQAAGNHPVTFHRAFDHCRQPLKALEQLIDYGCAHVLTSGQAPTAEAGIPLLRQLVEHANGRINILPGGGVNHLNARQILDATGATEIHASASITLSDGTRLTQAHEVTEILKAIS